MLHELTEKQKDYVFISLDTGGQWKERDKINRKWLEEKADDITMESDIVQRNASDSTPVNPGESA